MKAVLMVLDSQRWFIFDRKSSAEQQVIYFTWIATTTMAWRKNREKKEQFKYIVQQLPLWVHVGLNMN